MSNYNKSTNFAVKDTLTSGDPDKVVSGAEIDNEFNSIASAVTTKIDKVPGATTGNVPTLTASGGIQDSGVGRNVLSPTGAVTAFAADSAPSGWLECDGREVGRSTYPDLFNVIGTTFGAGDGSTTFELPNLRGEFIRGWDNGRGIDSGRGFGTSQEENFKSLKIRQIGDNLSLSDQTFVVPKDGSEVRLDRYTKNADNNLHKTHFYSYDSDEIRPRNIALMYIIKT